MNTLLDLLYDLAVEANIKLRSSEDLRQLAEEYLLRFKEENSKYLEWEAK